jgi:hypothetical protein
MMTEAEAREIGRKDGATLRAEPLPLKSPFALKVHITRHVQHDYLVKHGSTPGFARSWDAYREGFIEGYRS